KNGNLQNWIDGLEELGHSESLDFKVNDGYICLQAQNSPVDLKAKLQRFMPWRKGPWIFDSVKVETEWRSDWKWERLKDHITPLKNKIVLDVGCGNGYHCFRMADEGAKAVIGIDPGMMAVMQSQVTKRFSTETPAWVLPLGIDEMPKNWGLFDTVFSMGVLYHRKSPIDHLFHLKDLLKRGGELVLETIVVDDSYGSVLIPEDRYAKMRNVWFIPSVSTLERMVARTGFIDIRTVDVTVTSTGEQRSTEWMDFESLPDFLDKNDPSKTVEGYQAPRRSKIKEKKK
ncbi:MAG: tRNA 5-methoxyuridine(34)/uridine 5-oxyacetic acid(34) synthase CmoB, partial [Proteobacteria bacterium]|nr:tRNA 5-methoxyuridine(34)/uridine 5-oxyacetic acid(34) synthase CmoB [Pseudomonadota bacterium]